MKRSSLEFVSAQDAARLLGVQLPTIYSYVTRGWLRSVNGTRGRARRYSLEDVQRLKARHDARAGHTAVAAGALRWGEPVLETRIGDIDARGPRYRGHHAIDLAAAGHRFESVAELLWGHPLRGDVRWPRAEPRSRAHETSSPMSRAVSKIEREHPIDAMLRRLVAPSEVGEISVIDEARAIAMRCAYAVAPPAVHADAREPMTVAEVLNATLGGRSDESVRVIDQALILCAEHDLNASTLAARTAASAGASLRMCVIAALATLSGDRHGGLCDVVERWVSSLGDCTAASESVHNKVERGESLPGFAHPLYPDGDPRARALVDHALSLGGASPRVAIGSTLIAEVREATGLLPSLDMGLVMLAMALDAPAHSAITLFAVGRVAGWLAHAMEQREAAFLLRPRSQYVGE